MSKKLFSILGYFFLVLMLSGFFSSDPNEKANELFVKAMQFDQKMRAETGSYSNALESYERVQVNIEAIISTEVS